FYVDGVADPEVDYNVSFSFSSPAAIGSRGDNFYNVFLGAIDEVDVYGRALSSNEVAGIYNASFMGKCPIPPSVLTQPLSQTVTVGDNVVLSVLAQGTSLQYQWYFNGSILAGATLPALNLANVQTGQAGTYQV